MFYRRSVTKISVFIALALFFTLGNVFAETSEEANNQGIGYAKQGNLDGAITEFSKSIEINPNFAEAYLNRGLAYNSKGSYDQAITDFNRAIAIRPNYPDAYNNLAVAYFLKNDYDRSWENVHKAESLGYKVTPVLLDELKQASGREN